MPDSKMHAPFILRLAYDNKIKNTPGPLILMHSFLLPRN